MVVTSTEAGHIFYNSMAAQTSAKPAIDEIRRGRAGFSLIEVVFALGIVAFTCVTILGAIPIGLSSFQQANGATVEAQIVQNISNDILLANFSDLPQYNALSQYYDNTGSPLTTNVGAIFTATVSMVGVDLTNSPASLKNVSGNISAYKVQITLLAVNRPTQPHLYSLIVANNNL